MHVYRICNSTDYINAHHTIVYTYLILYCKDIHQPLSTITHDEWDVSIPGIIDPLCIGRCVFGTSLFTPARFHGGGSARKSCLFSHGFMPFFIWLHQQTIIQYLDGDEVEIAGNYCPSHLNRPKQSFYDLCDPVMLLATLRLLLRLLLMLLLQSMLLLLPLLSLLLLWLSWFSGNLNAVYSWSLWFDKNPRGTVFDSVLLGFRKLHSPFRCQKTVYLLWPKVTKHLTMQTYWGIVYRDLHPENVVITHDGNIKLCDLALVTWFDMFDVFALVESHWCFWVI